MSVGVQAASRDCAEHTPVPSSKRSWDTAAMQALTNRASKKSTSSKSHLNSLPQHPTAASPVVALGTPAAAASYAASLAAQTSHLQIHGRAPRTTAAQLMDSAPEIAAAAPPSPSLHEFGSLSRNLFKYDFIFYFPAENTATQIRYVLANQRMLSWNSSVLRDLIANESHLLCGTGLADAALQRGLHQMTRDVAGEPSQSSCSSKAYDQPDCLQACVESQTDANETCAHEEIRPIRYVVIHHASSLVYQQVMECLHGDCVWYEPPDGIDNLRFLKDVHRLAKIFDLARVQEDIMDYMCTRISVYDIAGMLFSPFSLDDLVVRQYLLKFVKSEWAALLRIELLQEERLREDSGLLDRTEAKQDILIRIIDIAGKQTAVNDPYAQTGLEHPALFFRGQRERPASRAACCQPRNATHPPTDALQLDSLSHRFLPYDFVFYFPTEDTVSEMKCVLAHQAALSAASPRFAMMIQHDAQPLPTASQLHSTVRESLTVMKADTEIATEGQSTSNFYDEPDSLTGKHKKDAASTGSGGSHPRILYMVLRNASSHSYKLLVDWVQSGRLYRPQELPADGDIAFLQDAHRLAGKFGLLDLQYAVLHVMREHLKLHEIVPMIFSDFGCNNEVVRECLLHLLANRWIELVNSGTLRRTDLRQVCGVSSTDAKSDLMLRIIGIAAKQPLKGGANDGPDAHDAYNKRENSEDSRWRRAPGRDDDEICAENWVEAEPPLGSGRLTPDVQDQWMDPWA